MSVKIDGAEYSTEHQGAEHYSCSSRCHDKFLADPEFYLSGAHLDAVEDVPAGTITPARCTLISASPVPDRPHLRHGARTGDRQPR